MASPSCSLGKGVGDDRRRVGEQERAADALNDPPQDELGPVAGESGTERGQCEQDEPQDIGLLAPELIREPAGAQHQHGRGDHVDEDHPHQLQQAGVKAPLQIRQSDDQRPGVDRRQQHPEARARQGPPLVGLVLRVHADTAAAPR
jgi:hypothetical protein